MSDPFLAEIRIWANAFAPRGWAFCDGQLININQHYALFALIGKTYGGDGKYNFALPKLTGRAAMGTGYTPGLIPRKLGDYGGDESIGLRYEHIPVHNHECKAMDIAGTSQTPSTKLFLARPVINKGRPTAYEKPSTIDEIYMAKEMTGEIGKSTKHENRQPFLSINYLIATAGIWPERP